MEWYFNVFVHLTFETQTNYLKRTLWIVYTFIFHIFDLADTL